MSGDRAAAASTRASAATDSTLAGLRATVRLLDRLRVLRVFMSELVPEAAAELKTALTDVHTHYLANHYSMQPVRQSDRPTDGD